MSDPFIGEIRAFPYAKFVPHGWLACDGRILQAASFEALAAVIGDRYGKLGPNTFALPDLRQRIAIGVGTEPRDPHPIPIALGQTIGDAKVTLDLKTLAAHTHQIVKQQISGGAAVKTSKPSATSNFGQLTIGTQTFESFASGSAASVHLDPRTVAPSGASPVEAHENRQPFLCMWFGIAYTGTFPIRP